MNNIHTISTIIAFNSYFFLLEVLNCAFTSNKTIFIENVKRHRKSVCLMEFHQILNTLFGQYFEDLFIKL